MRTNARTNKRIQKPNTRSRWLAANGSAPSWIDDEPLYLIKQTNQPCRVCFKGVFISFALFHYRRRRHRCCCSGCCRRRLPANRNSIRTLFVCIRVAFFFCSLRLCLILSESNFAFSFTRAFRINWSTSSTHTRYGCRCCRELVERCHVPIFSIICQISLEAR